ncbi:MAG: hypothetical protein D6733_04435 [Methanobacteriota archaeon]|nr:MAG: hypothetical protein D6733_04435 [Euryarchaeota archaeon]
MESRDHAGMVAAILTAGYIIKTESEAEDLARTAEIYRDIKKRYEGMAGSVEDEELSLMAAVLTAGQIVNASTEVAGVEAVMDDFTCTRRILLEMEKRYPGFLSEKAELNIIASVLVAGLIINTTDWEEGIMDNMLALRDCKNILKG